MKLLVAVPCMDFCHTDFVRSLVGLRVPPGVQYTFSKSSLIYDARDALANVAIESGCDRVLWLDSDMLFEPDLYERLAAHLDAGKEFVTGIYFARRAPVQPVLYKELRIEQQGAFYKPVADRFEDWPREEPFRIAGCGFGAVLMTTELLKRVRDACGLPFMPSAGYGEDLAFCLRATQLGAELWCDPQVRPGHIGLAVYDERSWRPERVDPEGKTPHPLPSAPPSPQGEGMADS